MKKHKFHGYLVALVISIFSSFVLPHNAHAWDKSNQITTNEIEVSHQDLASLFDHTVEPERFERGVFPSDLHLEATAGLLSENMECFNGSLDAEFFIYDQPTGSHNVLLQYIYPMLIREETQVTFVLLRSSKLKTSNKMTWSVRENERINTQVAYAFQLSKSDKDSTEIKTVINNKNKLGIRGKRKIYDQVIKLLSEGQSTCPFSKNKNQAQTTQESLHTAFEPKLHMTIDFYALSNKTLPQAYANYLRDNQPDSQQTVALLPASTEVVRLTSNKGESTDLTLTSTADLTHYSLVLALPKDEGEIGRVENISANTVYLMSAMLNNRNHLIRVAANKVGQ